MARDIEDEREVLEAFEGWRREHPDAAFVVGTVRVMDSQSGCITQFGLVDCGPVELVAAANDLLEAASEKLRTYPRASEMHDLIVRVESAMMALDFTVRGTAQ
ncbi:hypothetical protein BV511_03040 [Methylorubrum extorquens]|uniref:hypothetical protein n=1 Tax=Methylorubrum extorquens TaxID=408 RepID=UPI00097271FC|nr:hypothetical protein [Methylorubrum extorquens]APX83793.1 hypothetical protein BV511_03040 [Methylorubrum extorquens]